jgi:hypothetical protein
MNTGESNEVQHCCYFDSVQGESKKDVICLVQGERQDQKDLRM